ncbi:unnamed protein product [Diamesa hyperborea]
MIRNCLRFIRAKQTNLASCRKFQTVTGTEKCSEPYSRGLVVGVYSDENDRTDTGRLTPMGAKYNETYTNGRLMELLKLAGPMPKRGEVRIFFGLEPRYSAIAVAGLGSEGLSYESYEIIDEAKEAIRVAAATGCKALQNMETSRIYVESFGHAESAAEGASMTIWLNQELKSKEQQVLVPQLAMHVERGIDSDFEGWKIGLQKAAAQNLARQLMETPANLMTPTLFAQNVVNVLCKSGVNCEIKVRGWAESQQMHSFLSVARGSCEPPIFMELSYYGADREDRPIVLIGQGNTFDSGGTCIKSSDDLMNMRGDMAGAACVVAACRAIAALELPVNIRGLIPLCEHMIGYNALRPGDIITAMNGKSIEVEDTSNEGPLVLVDALLYAQNYWPKFIVDVSTMSPQMLEGFGKSCSGVFTNSEALWEMMKNASIHTGDRVWRLPLWNYFSDQIKSSPTVDIQNIGRGHGGDTCKSAALLREFVPCGDWLHMDTFNVMTTNGEDYPYLRRGMAGRPTRTLIEFIAQHVCQTKQCGQKKPSRC